MGDARRFSKQLVLERLDKLTTDIAAKEKFDRNNGTSQLGPIFYKDGRVDEAAEAMLRRAVEYGRMRALEQFAEAVAEGRLS